MKRTDFDPIVQQLNREHKDRLRSFEIIETPGGRGAVAIVTDKKGRRTALVTVADSKYLIQHLDRMRASDQHA